MTFKEKISVAKTIKDIELAQELLHNEAKGEKLQVDELAWLPEAIAAFFKKCSANSKWLSIINLVEKVYVNLELGEERIDLVMKCLSSLSTKPWAFEIKKKDRKKIAGLAIYCEESVSVSSLRDIPFFSFFMKAQSVAIQLKAKVEDIKVFGQAVAGDEDYITSTLDGIDDLQCFDEHTIFPLNDLSRLLEGILKETPAQEPEGSGVKKEAEVSAESEFQSVAAVPVETEIMECPGCSTEFEVNPKEMEAVWTCPKCKESFELEIE